VSNLELFSMATSLGGVESLVQFPAALTPIVGASAAGALPGGSVVRISVGCEDFDDLRQDLVSSLSRL
jgi:cystathionine gamma-synthase